MEGIRGIRVVEKKKFRRPISVSLFFMLKGKQRIFIFQFYVSYEVRCLRPK